MIVGCLWLLACLVMGSSVDQGCVWRLSGWLVSSYVGHSPGWWTACVVGISLYCVGKVFVCLVGRSLGVFVN